MGITLGSSLDSTLRYSLGTLGSTSMYSVCMHKGTLQVLHPSKFLSTTLRNSTGITFGYQVYTTLRHFYTVLWFSLCTAHRYSLGIYSRHTLGTSLGYYEYYLRKISLDTSPGYSFILGTASRYLLCMHLFTLGSVSWYSLITILRNSFGISNTLHALSYSLAMLATALRYWFIRATGLYCSPPGRAYYTELLF